MKYVVVDIEADGPAPGLYSMLQLGAVVVEPFNAELFHITDTFVRYLAPISHLWIDDALKHGVKVDRQTTLGWPVAEQVMHQFYAWLHLIKGNDRILFVSDNAGFDWMFVNYYLWKFCGDNPFGHSSFSLTSFYKGYARNMRASFKHLRQTSHTHDALDDARGNAEALLTLLHRMMDV